MQADPAFTSLQKQTNNDRDTAIQEQTQRDTAAALSRYGARLTLLGRGSQAPLGLGSTPTASASAAPATPAPGDPALAAFLKIIGSTSERRLVPK